MPSPKITLLPLRTMDQYKRCWMLELEVHVVGVVLVVYLLVLENILEKLHTC